MTELDPESRQVLMRARAARTPSAEDRERVARRLAVAVGVSVGAAASAAVAKAGAAASGVGVQAAGAAARATGLQLASAGTTAGVQTATAIKTIQAGGSWSAVKIGLAASLLLSAAVGAYVSFARSGHAPRADATAAPTHERTAPAEVRSTTDSSSHENTGPLPSLAAASARATSSAREEAAASDNSRLHGETQPLRAAAQQARGASRRALENNAPAQRHTTTLGDEVELLHRAQAAWRTRAAPRALELLRQHRTRYPHSELRSEREALEVLVLCEVGQSKQAARLARALLNREPKSPARAAIEQSCAAK